MTWSNENPWGATAVQGQTGLRQAWRVGAGILALGVSLCAQDLGTRAWDLERRGQSAAAEKLLRDASSSSESANAVRAYAEFLEGHRDPGARAAYQKLGAMLEKQGAPTA